MPRPETNLRQRLTSAVLLGVPVVSLPLLGFALLGCGGCGNEAQAQTPIEVTPACPRSEGAVWESAPWPTTGAAATCEWINFDGRQTYIIEHNRGAVPLLVAPYLSFHPNGDSSVPSAGDMTRIIAVDENTVTLRNNTNENFFLKLVLQ